MYTPLVRTPDEYKTEQSRAKRESEKQKIIIIKCYKFYYEDFIIYFPVGGLDIKKTPGVDYSAPERTV